MRLNQQSVTLLTQKLVDLDYLVNGAALDAVEMGAKRIVDLINNLPWTEHPLWPEFEGMTIGETWFPPVAPYAEYAHGAEMVGSAPDPFGAGEMPFTRAGELQESVYFAAHVDDSSALSEVYSTAPHAPALELGVDAGGFKMGPYPFMWPTVENNTDELLLAMADEFGDKWRRAVARVAK